MVEATGLEPAASCSQSRHSTKLSYASMDTETGDSQTALTVIKYTLQGGDLSSVFCKKKENFLWVFPTRGICADGARVRDKRAGPHGKGTNERDATFTCTGKAD